MNSYKQNSMRMVTKRKSLLQIFEQIPLWVWPFMALGVIILVLIPAIGLARLTTSNSTFCISCHGTGETPDRSKISLVHPDFNKVSCVDCHAKGGHVVYEGYVKGFMAEEERVSPNCAKCHQSMTKRDDTKDFKFNFLDVNITHKSHLERGAICTTCHANIAHDLAEVPTNRPVMNSCYSCHVKTDSCTKCHGQKIPSKPLPPPAPVGLGMPGDGRVYYMRICSACHGAQGNQVPAVNLRLKEYLDKQGIDRLAKVIKTGKGNMHGFGLDKGGFLNDDQIRAVAAYLVEEAVSKVEPNPEVLYNRYCLVCHGQGGDKIAGISLFSGEFWSLKDEEDVLRSIQIGKGGMPAFSKTEGGNLTRQEISSLVQYLSMGANGSLPAGDGQKESSKRQTPTLQGKALYDKNCSACHGADGNQLPAALLGSANFVKQKGSSELSIVTSEGKSGMPPFGKLRGGNLDDMEIEAIIKYLTEGAK